MSFAWNSRRVLRSSIRTRKIPARCWLGSCNEAITRRAIQEKPRLSRALALCYFPQKLFGAGRSHELSDDSFHSDVDWLVLGRPALLVGRRPPAPPGSWPARLARLLRSIHAHPDRVHLLHVRSRF